MGFALTFLAETYAAYALVVEPGSLPIPRTAATLLGLWWVASVILLPFVFLLFPDGRPPGRRWGFLAWAVAGVGGLLLLLFPLRPEFTGSLFANPFGVGGSVGYAIVFITDAGLTVILVAIVLSALSLVFRYRRASGVQRQQIKWFALAAVLFSIPMVPDALGVNPLRRRVQAFVDRHFYRRKYDAAKTLAAFNARLREETDLDALSNELVGWSEAPCSPSTSLCGYAPMLSPGPGAPLSDSSGTTSSLPPAYSPECVEDEFCELG